MAANIIPAELWAELCDRSPWHSVRCFTAADEERCRRAEDAWDAAAAAAAASQVPVLGGAGALPPAATPAPPLGTQTAVWAVKFAASVLHGAALILSDLATRHYAAFLVPASLLAQIRAGRDVEMTLQQALRMADSAIRSGSTGLGGSSGAGAALNGPTSSTRGGGDGNSNSSVHIIDPTGSGAAFGHGPNCTVLVRLRTRLRLRGIASTLTTTTAAGGAGDVFLPLEMRIPMVPIARDAHDPLERAQAEAAFLRDAVLRPALSRLVAAEALCDVAVMDALRCRGLVNAEGPAAAGVLVSLAQQTLPRVERYLQPAASASSVAIRSSATIAPELATLLQVGLGDSVPPAGIAAGASAASGTIVGDSHASSSFVGFRAALAALDAACVDAQNERQRAAAMPVVTGGDDGGGFAAGSPGGLLSASNGSERSLRRSASSYVETPEEKQRRMAMRRERDMAAAAVAAPAPGGGPPAAAAVAAATALGSAAAAARSGPSSDAAMAAAVAQQQRAAAAVQKKLQRVFR